MENINKLIFRVNDNLRNNLEVDKQDIKELLSIAMDMEKQLSISRVVGQSEQLKCPECGSTDNEPYSAGQKCNNCNYVAWAF